MKLFNKIIITAIFMFSSLVVQAHETGHQPVKKETKSVVTEVVNGHYIYGDKWPSSPKQTLSISEVLNEPSDYYSQPHKFSGRVTKVCQKKGCWMILTGGEKFARVDFNSHAFYIPKDTDGEAIVYGHLKQANLSESKIAHLKEDGAGELKADSYEIIATSVMLK